MIYSVANDTVQGAVNADKLGSEIIAADCVINFKGIEIQGDVLSILCDEAEDPSGLDAVIHAHVAVTLDDNKTRKKIAIDTRSQEIIRDGFTFDGHKFSLSANAQINWVGIVVFQAGLSWPLGLTTDDDYEYDLTLVNLPAFVGAALTVVNTVIASGRALKIECNDAADQAALDAVVDNR